MLLSRQMWVSSRYECSLSTNKVTHIQGSGGHCRCHYNSLHVEQLPFFHVFQASMKRSWSARHAPSPSRVTRSPRLAHPRLKKRKNSPYSVGYCHKGLPNQRYNVPSFQKDNRRRLSSRYTNESIQGLLPL